VTETAIVRGLTPDNGSKRQTVDADAQGTRVTVGAWTTLP
jgi:hypothetical protein